MTEKLLGLAEALLLVLFAVQDTKTRQGPNLRQPFRTKIDPFPGINATMHLFSLLVSYCLKDLPLSRGQGPFLPCNLPTILPTPPFDFGLKKREKSEDNNF